VAITAAAFALLGVSPLFGVWGKAALLTAAALIACGSGLTSPTLPAFASQRASATTQGLTLGTLQSASALARALGPILGGALYATIAPSAPYLIGAAGLLAAVVLAIVRLH
jgi:DHA1 family tetracycline resistance protein-like MFS transporter